MSTNRSNSRPAAAERATRQAEQGADAWETATAAQRAAVPPNHGGFYALAAEMVATLRHFDELCEVLTRQVACYGHTVTEHGGVLRDDEPGHDPGERIAIASSWAAQTRTHIAAAERAANRFWSEVGHLAIDCPPGTVEGTDADEVTP